MFGVNVVWLVLTACCFLVLWCFGCAVSVCFGVLFAWVVLLLCLLCCLGESLVLLALGLFVF